MAKVVVTDHSFGDLSYEEAEAKKAGAQFVIYQCKNESDVIAAVQDGDVILNGFARITANVLQSMKPDAVIVHYGVGVDNIDIKTAKKLGIKVCNIPDYGVDEVADHAVAFILALSRKLTLFDTQMRKGKWGAQAIAGHLTSLRDSTLGIIGFGHIGQMVNARMQAFGIARVLVNDPYISAEIAKDHKVELVDRNQLLQQSHIITLHAPEVDDTDNLINKATLEMIMPGSIIVNVARGRLIDESALAEALKSGHIAGAGLDVFYPEPPLATSPLMDAPNVLMSPHAAFFSDRSLKKMHQLAADECSRALAKKPLRSPAA